MRCNVSKRGSRRAGGSGLKPRYEPGDAGTPSSLQMSLLSQEAAFFPFFSNTVEVFTPSRKLRAVPLGSFRGVNEMLLLPRKRGPVASIPAQSP